MSTHNSLIQRVSCYLVMLYKIRLISKIKGKQNNEILKNKIVTFIQNREEDKSFIYHFLCSDKTTKYYSIMHLKIYLFRHLFRVVPFIKSVFRTGERVIFLQYLSLLQLLSIIVII